jgi:putative ABC transport system permease protein
MGMLSNCFKTAWRNIRRQKLYTIINVTGLSIGMACSLLILLFVYDELNVDRFHENADQIYRVYLILEENGQKLPVALTPSPLAAALKNEYPEVSNSVCVKRSGNISIRYQDQWTTAETTNYTYPAFFDIFSFTFLQGSQAEALVDPKTIVLTESLSKKIFKHENPIGRTLHLRDIGNLKVTGVINDQKNTHIRLEGGAILPFDLYKEERPRKDPWQRANYTTYVILQKNAEPEAFNHKIDDYLKKIYGPEVKARFQLQPIKAIWLHSNFAYDFLNAPYDIRVVYLIITVAFFLLITAGVNYMNLATAQSEHRTEEVGLRKVMGADRMQIIFQFLGETVLLSCIALVCAILLAEIFLPGFNNLVEIRELILFEPKSISILLTLLLVAVLTGIISGSYPALFVSSFQPAEIFRRQMPTVLKKTVLRKFLLITQFTISITLIIATLTLHGQLKYMLTKDLGYNPQNMLYLPMTQKIRSVYDAIRKSLLHHTAISHVTAALNLPDWRGPSAELSEWEGNTTGKSIRMYHGSVDYDFIDTFQMKITRGSTFSEKSSAKGTSGLIVNEEAVRLMELEEPIGKRLKMWNHDGRIIGVVKDFHFNNVKYKVEPLVLKMAPDETRILVIKILPENVPQILSFIEDILHRVDPDYAFKPEFLRDALHRAYTLEQKMAQLFKYSTFLAILISCLGLFGLSAYTIEKRTKELAIRKACGAATIQIVKMLSVEFIKLVLIANLIAWPIAYFALKHWLQNYAYHISIKATPFLISAALALIVALLSIGYQVIKAARANPVDALRYE